MDNTNREDQHQESACTLNMGRGCSFCHNGSETVVSSCEGCYKLHSYNWLEGMPEVIPSDIYEVRFKNTRKSYYRNVNNLSLKRGDIVAVEAAPGHDIGIVSMTGDLVARQMKRIGFNPQNGEFKKIYRKAKPYDIEKWQEAIALEHETMIRARQIAADMKLNMKIGDVEYQGDKIKAIFYYIADERVDFRELIKVFAEQFRIRVEMKQIGARQEAGRIGGLGSCGRELCCASWIANFVSVTTNSARQQEISLNPQKLAGQCGKLKCCLVYELDTYIDARKEFPHLNQPLQTEEGEFHLVKSDILNRTMWFAADPGSQSNMIPLSVNRVREILRANQKGVKVAQLSPDATRPRFRADICRRGRRREPDPVRQTTESPQKPEKEKGRLPQIHRALHATRVKNGEPRATLRRRIGRARRETNPPKIRPTVRPKTEGTTKPVRRAPLAEITRDANATIRMEDNPDRKRKKQETPSE